MSFEQLIKVTRQVEVKRVRECAIVRGPLELSLRTVRDIQIDGDLPEACRRLDQTYPSGEGELHQVLDLEDRGAPTDDDEDGAKTPTEDEPALLEGIHRAHPDAGSPCVAYLYPGGRTAGLPEGARAA